MHDGNERRSDSEEEEEGAAPLVHGDAFPTSFNVRYRETHAIPRAAWPPRMHHQSKKPSHFIYVDVLDLVHQATE